MLSLGAESGIYIVSKSFNGLVISRSDRDMEAVKRSSELVLAFGEW